MGKYNINTGKTNTAFIDSSKYYNLYHTLPDGHVNPLRYAGLIIFFLVFLTLLILLFLYAFFSELKKTPGEVNGIMILCLAFAILFAIADFFTIRGISNRLKKWTLLKKEFIYDTGVIIGKWYESTAQVDIAGGIEYYIAVQYDGFRKIRACISSKVFNKLKINDKVKVRFVRTQRNVCELI